MEDKVFKADAKQIVDMCFDTKIFKDHITRDDMNTMEDHIAFLMQSRFEGYQKIISLMDKINKSPKVM